MELLLQQPVLYLVGLFLATQVIVFAARDPLRRGLYAVGRALATGLRLTARWCLGVASGLREHSRAMLLQEGRIEAEERLEKELGRLQEGIAKDLRHYPELHSRLDTAVVKLTSDLEQCTGSPPDPPGWSEACRAVAAIPQVSDGGSKKVLDDIKSMAVSGEKKALKQHREAVGRRHKILRGLAPLFRDVRRQSGEMLGAVNRALERTGRIDKAIEHYETVKRADDGSERVLSSDMVSLFLVSTLVMTVALGGAFVNFQLIALPMAELVPAGTRVGGVAVPTIAALVIVLMEAAAGIFLMEALGMTDLFPKIARLPKGKRQLILVVAATGLLLLACVESSLAILRENIVEADMELKRALAGGSAVEAATTSTIVVAGQAVLGFLLPWLLAMVALPLETLLQSGRHIVARVIAALLSTLGNLLRVGSLGARYLAPALASVVDVYVSVPLLIQRWATRRPGGSDAEDNSLQPVPVPEPARATHTPGPR